MWKNVLLVMIGGGIGSVLRYIITTVLKTNLKIEHWATFWVNITGCFLLGLLFKFFLSMGSCMYDLVIVGIIGSYTTFSAFEYENIDLIAHERYLEFIKYSTFSCGFAFLSVAFGFMLQNLL